ncbi:cell wall protein AWA1 isoform X1 [Drosophila erecta]|uniref:cell wall protein AWA1 isoform X1 n=1 Tax=Drosophila erecta TaxID=7220 RepID=UPI000F04EF33|nr:cell wall protein AWA1 isoform X1 [Drosophila erecta]XP_026838796.1 cell wall protein AWA1 isoform X1 [Drosophila erecta]XP_026838797.1 cell wall protein AWA1 isoform X1 [Drosophila erecta]
MMALTAASALIATSASLTNSASTDCSSSIQGSTTSSASSDVMTLTTTAASSWCAIPASSRLRVLRLVRPHQRRLLVGGPERGSTYGFTVRGGREHGTGFFVSHVEHGGEAQLKGLRIGDQILRINGFRLDDAVHKEFIQLVAGQDRVTLKVRGVGMLPVRDLPEERLSWSVVKLPSVSGTPSESSFKGERRGASRDISVVLHVAPRTKLGLGICKGPEWKPGIFVQFTKERSVAREAGLRPGDQILSVNSIDFSDVLFSEAVAVMKSSSKLDMVVRTAAGCDLFPGESSGYNSSASSVTGDQSPCWADAKSKRLTAVREESGAGAGGAGGGLSSAPGAGGPNWAQGVEVHKQMNKTIIKLTENGTSINNTYIASSGGSSVSGSVSGSGSGSSASGTSGRSQQSQSHPTRNSTTMKRSQLRPVSSSVSGIGLAGGSAGSAGSGSGSGGVSAAPAPPPPAMHEGASASGSVGSSLSSAITEELKKRKEKQQQQQQRSNRDRDRDVSGNGNVDRQPTSHNGNGVANGGHRGSSGQVSHRQRANVAGVAATLQGSERTSNLAGAGGAGGSGGSSGAGGDQHTALMDEFKRAHQRMFRNGFHESEHKERGETLKRTSIMPDESCYRNSISSNGFSSSRSSSNSNTGNFSNSSRLQPQNGVSPANGSGSPELPPPPPQFANPQPKQVPPQQLKLMTGNGVANGSGSGGGSGNGNGTGLGNGSVAKVKQPMSPMRSASISVGGFRPPATPQPDYDAVQLRSPPGSAAAAGRDVAASQQQRRTLRLGTVTIGEYGDQRTTGKRDTQTGSALRKTNGEPASNGILKNGSNRSSASFNHGSSHQAEKSIKFGN